MDAAKPKGRIWALQLVLFSNKPSACYVTGHITHSTQIKLTSFTLFLGMSCTAGSSAASMVDQHCHHQYMCHMIEYSSSTATARFLTLAWPFMPGLSTFTDDLIKASKAETCPHQRCNVCYRFTGPLFSSRQHRLLANKAHITHLYVKDGCCRPCSEGRSATNAHFHRPTVVQLLYSMLPRFCIAGVC